MSDSNSKTSEIQKEAQALADLAFFLFAPDGADYDRYQIRLVQFEQEAGRFLNAAVQRAKQEGTCPYRHCPTPTICTQAGACVADVP